MLRVLKIVFVVIVYVIAILQIVTIMRFDISIGLFILGYSIWSVERRLKKSSYKGR